MRTEVIKADTIDEAATRVLEVLKEKAYTTRNPSSRDNVFYLDGWDGLGASAVLRNIAQRLTATTPAGKRALAELGFEQVIHIDCSMWKSRRAFQRAVAEQLKLPDKVMKMFDQQDEEDDFRGVAQDSRDELQQVVREMQRHMQKLDRKFLVIFYNGSSEEIDLASLLGFPLSGYSTNKVLWTFQGKFLLRPKMKVDRAIESAGTTDVFISASPYYEENEKLWPYLVLQEAAELVATCKINNGVINQPAVVAECFQYLLEVGCRGRHLIDYDLVTHIANYWICDGIIQQGEGDTGGAAADVGGDLWRAADALQREVRLDVDYHEYLPSSQLVRSWKIESKPYWTSPTYGFILVPFGAIPNDGMFQHYSEKLRVLKLSSCTFNFLSPPFLCCHSLRFLWLNHCQDTGTSTDRSGKEEDIRRCFQRLWVLDMRSTDCGHILSAHMLDLMTHLMELNVMGANDWDIGQLQGRLPNVRKLRVKYSSVWCSCPKDELFSGMNKMELLDFSGNKISSMRMRRLFGPGTITSSSCLETVITDDRFDVDEMSFRGCTRLKNLLLRGWVGVYILDISGTAVKTLDLTATRITYLNELYLLGCDKLYAITWPPKYKMKKDIDMLRIDTTQSASTAQSREEIAKRGATGSTIGTSAATTTVLHGSRPTSEFPWYISVKDARLLRSLEAVFSYSRKIHVEVSSPASPNTSDAGGCKDEEIKMGGRSDQQVLASLQRQNAPAIYATDSTMNHLPLQQVTEGDGGAPGIMWMWPCPNVPDLPEKSCYMHVQDGTRTKLLSQGGEETSTIIVPGFVLGGAKILHVHDSLSITQIPLTTSWGSEWYYLEWCRIERCPRVVDSIFTCAKGTVGYFIFRLRTFWASQLLKACYIWKWSEASGYGREFEHLTLLHLDFCPRMIHVLPLSTQTFRSANNLSQLKTLEITWCGDLREVFPLDIGAKDYVERQQRPVTLDFPSLKRIHLHELPSLQRICGVRMSAPNLETVKIRGCWSLKRLPDVGDGNKVVECDCEKEWWDKLEWDDGSQATRYKPVHSRYYKKTHLRSTVLR